MKPSKIENAMKESTIQSELMKWAKELSVVYPELELINASLNGIVTTAKIKNMMKGQGMKKGYPDIFLPVSRMVNGVLSHGLFIELKQEDGRPTKEQLWWNERLNAEGYMALFCYSLDDAKKIICNYLQIRC